MQLAFPYPFAGLVVATTLGACIKTPNLDLDSAGDNPFDAVDTGSAADSEVAEATGAADRQAQDIAEYEVLAATLEMKRSEFRGAKADEIYAIGTRLFWLEFDGWDPYLRSYDPSRDAETRYTFGIGGGDAHNYRASNDAILTAIPDGDKVHYRMYAIDTPERLIAEVSVDKPKDEQRWWAYAIEGTTAYMVTTDPAVELHRFGPDQALTPVLDLEQDAGADVGIFWEFGIEGDTMVFVESGRIWSLDLRAGRATWLGNETEVSGNVDFGTSDAVFSTATGTLWFDYASKDLVDLDAAIAENGYQLNDTFAAAHLHAGGDWSRRGHVLVYKGMDGIFAYDWDADVVTPILLDPRLEAPERLVYSNPQILRDGQMFIQGLYSESGSVGADGPIYRVSADALGH